MNHSIQRVAHRGGSHLAPENTLAAFRNALTLPIDAIELDIHMSRDGHAVVFHDYTVDRRTNGSGNILDLGRYPKIAETVVEELRAADMLDKVLIISFDWAILSLIKSLEPVVQTGVLVSKDVWNPRAERALRMLVEEVTMLGCNWINVDYDLFTAEMLEAAHEHGFRLGIWTVNTTRAMRRFAAAGVDSLTSDRPDLFSALQV